jgi:putative nucleotidyltransferase with HDIG domain
MHGGVQSMQQSPSLAVSRRLVLPEPRSVAGRSPRRPPTRHPARLMLAFEALDTFPVLAESRDRLLSALAKDDHATADIVSAVESDASLVSAVMRLANAGQPRPGRVDTVACAVDLIRPDGLRALAEGMRTFDFFGRAGIWDCTPERFRLHAVATQRAADRIAASTDYADRDRLAVTSLLHDIGKLVLIHAHPGYPGQIHQGARTPEKRIQQERRELGIDHAVVGGVLIRRWGLPDSLATPIERHHNHDAEGEAAIVRLADMLANHDRGAPVSSTAMLQSARAIDLSPKTLRRLMQEPTGSSRRRLHPDPSPLSPRELEVLQQLAKGSVYNQIAYDLALTASTVRSHLHNIYGKFGVVDRAQAVLFATRRGWI